MLFQWKIRSKWMIWGYHYFRKPLFLGCPTWKTRKWSLVTHERFFCGVKVMVQMVQSPILRGQPLFSCVSTHILFFYGKAPAQMFQATLPGPTNLPRIPARTKGILAENCGYFSSSSHLVWFRLGDQLQETLSFVWFMRAVPIKVATAWAFLSRPNPGSKLTFSKSKRHLYK